LDKSDLAGKFTLLARCLKTASLTELGMDTLNKYMKYFGFIIVAFFFILGFLLIFSDFFNYIPAKFRFIFAAIIILYSAFRLAVIFYKPKEPAGNEE
jgi:hypothetical protein